MVHSLSACRVGGGVSGLGATPACAAVGPPEGKDRCSKFFVVPSFPIFSSLVNQSTSSKC